MSDTMKAEDYRERLNGAIVEIFAEVDRTVSKTERDRLIALLVKEGWSPKMLRGLGLAKRGDFRWLISESDWRRLPLD
jgi:hypothetical protein